MAGFCRKEMKNVRVAFKILEDGEKVAIGHQEINVILSLMLKWKTFAVK